MHFRKLCFPTIELAAVHPIHCIIHSFFWRTSCGFTQLQNASPTRPRAIILIFFFSSLEAFLVVVNDQPKWNLRIDCIWMWKTLQGLLKDVVVETMIIVTIDQKSCKRILICGSACICSSVFGLFCIYHYSFRGVFQVIALLYCVGTSRFGISWIAWTFETTNSRNWLKNASS